MRCIEAGWSAASRHARSRAHAERRRPTSPPPVIPHHAPPRPKITRARTRRRDASRVGLAACRLHALAVHLLVLLHVGLDVAVHDGDGHEDARARADRADEVGGDGERADAHAAEGRRRRDVATQLGADVVGAGALARDHDALALPLLRDVVHRLARELDPGLGEERAGGEHEGDVEDGVEDVVLDVRQVARRREVVGKAAVRHAGVGRVLRGPRAEQLDEQVAAVLLEQELRDEVHVGDERGEEDDGDVGRVEQLDRLGVLRLALVLLLHADLDLEALHGHDEHEDGDGGEQVADVGQVLAVRAVEGVDERALVVGRVGGQQLVEERDDGALELGAARGLADDGAARDGGRREGLPDDALADVGGEEERDARAHAVAAAQHLVQHQHHHASHEQLQDEQDRVAGAHVRDLTEHAGEDVHGALAERDEQAEELLRAVEQHAVLAQRLVDLEDVRAGEQLHDQAGRHQRRDAELHEGAAVRGQDGAHPVEGVVLGGGVDAVQGDLAAHQEDDEGDDRPHHAVLEGHRLGRALALGQHDHRRLQDVEERHGSGAGGDAGGLTPEEIDQVEGIVNGIIEKALPVHSKVVPLADARRIHSLRAVFGETYPDPVRVVAIGEEVPKLVADPDNAAWGGLSVELCGGTHLRNSSQAHRFHVVEESSIAKGIRRIVAVTRDEADKAHSKGGEMEGKYATCKALHFPELEEELRNLQVELGSAVMPAGLKARLQAEHKALEKRMIAEKKDAGAKLVETAVEGIVAQWAAAKEAGEKFIVVDLPVGMDNKVGKKALVSITKAAPDITFIGFDADAAKVLIFAAVGPDSRAKLGAGAWVKVAAGPVDGKGGGKPDSAQASGKNPAGVDAAKGAAAKFAAEKLA
uniref:alanine--tRNA ligase n=1 Tax=Bicosoecida sp. CB-2014 TaxID=1486930 RepID=A0A7S1C9Y9_9STRA|mmetsp:Transcript_18991/g.67064  ORF Transcript_18991/g.67064 Transcript_18991/m.67064 type:complete len:872 (+) Transcript_18991:35-2650(+)